MTVFAPEIWIPLFVLRFAMDKLFGIQLEVVIGYIAFGFIVALRNTVSQAWREIMGLVTEDPYRPSEPTPTSVLDLNDRYRLGLSEVVLGFDQNGSPIRVDLEKRHTLIVGVTGSGKSVCLKGTLVQLLQRDKMFLDKYHVVIFDFKGVAGDDYSVLSHIVDGYYNSRDGISLIADKLEGILHDMKTSDKRYAIFMDEMDMFTEGAKNERARGAEAIRALVAQVRTKGFVVASTQRPHFQSVPRNTTAQLERKVCFRVEDERDAKQLVFRTRKNFDVRFEQFRDGEFMLKEPGLVNPYRHGQALNVTRSDIEALVFSMAGDQDTVMQQVVAQATAGVKIGGMLNGVNKITPHVEGVTNNDIAKMYQTLAEHGVLEPKLNKNGKVAYYKLSVPSQEAIERAGQL